MFETSPSPVRAVIVTKPEMSVPLLVMNCFAPFTTQSSPSSSARVRDVAGVGAGLGLGQSEGAEALARAQPRHPLVLQRVGAERVHRPRAERGVRGHRDRHARVHPRQLLDRDRVAEVVRAAAPVLLGVRHPHQAELAELGHDLVREALLAIELLGHRSHLAVGEVAHQAPDLLLLLGQVELHAARDASPRAARSLSAESAMPGSGRRGRSGPGRPRSRSRTSSARRSGRAVS